MPAQTIVSPNTLADAIIQARKDSPNRRAINIASDLGCSRERVRQVLISAGLDTKVPGWVGWGRRGRKAIGPRVQGMRIKVAPPLPGITAIKIAEGVELPKVCPRCNGIRLCLSEDIDTVELECFTCGQLIAFEVKYLGRTSAIM